MKMRLQIASVLPAPAKAEPVGSQGKGVFGATLQAVMGLPDTARTQLATIGTPPGKLTPLNTNNEAGKLDGPIEELAGQVHWMSKEASGGSSSSGFPAQPADQGEPIEGTVVSQTGLEGSAISKKPLTGSVAQTPTIEQAIIQSSIVKTPQVTSESDPIRQPRAGAKPGPTASSKSTSSQSLHKAETTHVQLHATADQSSGMVTPVLPLSDFVVPAVKAQLDGSHSAPSQPASNLVGSRVHGQGQSGPVPVQSMTTSQAAASNKSFAALGSQLLTHAGAAATARGGETLRGPTSVTADRIAGSQPASPSAEKSSATIVASATRPLQSKAAHSVAESSEGAATQTDVRTLKDAEQKTGTEGKSTVEVSMPAQSSPAPATVEHQAAPNLSPANLQGTEKGIAPHRPEASAAQMLQRMDMAASPGVVQLRADARRLDVGVSSATLGWVEVRATSGPSGRIDATLQTQNDVSAHVLAGQSSEISSYAREHSVQLGQVSVGVGTGGSTQGDSSSTRHGSQDENATPTREEVVRSQTSTQQAHHAADVVSLINVRV
jgi:hypothetical protein